MEIRKTDNIYSDLNNQQGGVVAVPFINTNQCGGVVTSFQNNNQNGVVLTPFQGDNQNGVQIRFQNDGSVLEGIFINENIYGPGTKYLNGKISYKGEFSNGLMHGKGELYYENGYVKYGGDFVDGVPHGYGVSYYENGSRCYEGTLVNGLAHGLGKAYDTLGNYYSGNFANGHLEGSGMKIDTAGVVYHGNFTKSTLNGYGVMYDKGIKIEGDFVENRLNGICTGFYNNGEKAFIREYVNGVIEGMALECDLNGMRRDVYYRNGQQVYSWDLQGHSVYWDIIFNNHKVYYDGEVINGRQTYNLLLEILRNKAMCEVDIASPWISELSVKCTELLDAMKIALSRGVNIKIICGMGKERRESTRKQMKELSSELRGYLGKISIIEVVGGDTHKKIVLCDNKFSLVGSHNVLSHFPGVIEYSDELMDYSTNMMKVDYLRRTFFN